VKLPIPIFVAAKLFVSSHCRHSARGARSFGKVVTFPDGSSHCVGGNTASIPKGENTASVDSASSASDHQAIWPAANRTIEKG